MLLVVVVAMVLAFALVQQYLNHQVHKHTQQPRGEGNFGLEF